MSKTVNPFTLLKKDHRKVEAIFKKLEKTTERAVKTRRRLFKKLRQELDLHTHAEEKILYPRLKKNDSMKDLTLESFEEHHVVKVLLAELENLPASDEMWLPKLVVLKENVKHHVEEEETDLFIKAQKALDEGLKEKITQGIEKTKEQDLHKPKKTKLKRRSAMKTLHAVFAFLTASFLLGTASAAADTVSGERALDAVNHVIERHVDAEKGYRDASEEVNDADLRAAFLKKSEDREDFRQRLQSGMVSINKEYEKGGSIEGAAHRAWIDVKSFVTDESDLAVLNAIRTGEAAALKSFRGLLGEPLNDELRMEVQKQYDSVLDSYNWIVDEIKDRSKAAVNNNR